MEWILHVAGAMIGATVGAAAANKFALNRERRQESIKLFIGINESTHVFCHALQEAIDTEAYFRQLEYTQAHVDQHNPPGMRTKQEKIDAAEKAFDAAAATYKSVIPPLRAKAVAVRLHFGYPGRLLVEAITELVEVRQNLSKYKISELEETAFVPLRAKIEKQIDELWKTVI